MTLRQQRGVSSQACRLATPFGHIAVLVSTVALAAPVRAQGDSPTATPTMETPASDAGAAQTTRPVLANFEEFANVEVSQYGGVMVLSGNVADEASKSALSALVAQLPGVKHVYDRTRVAVGADAPRNRDAELVAELRGVFDNVSGLEDVTVNVHSGVVTLSGESPSARLIDDAVAVAKGTEGVRFVENGIRQTSLLGPQMRLPVDRLKERLTSWARQLPLALVAIGIVAMAVALARLLRGLDAPYRWIHGTLLKDIVRRTVGAVVIISGLLTALELMELTALVGAVFGAAGAAGIILGFAFREIMENYLASLLLSMRRPFLANDHVHINDLEGKVIRLTSRDTILMTLEGNHLRVPNSIVFKAQILNYTRNPLRRFDFAVGIGVDEDITSAVELGRNELAKTPGVCTTPPCFARVEELGDSNVALRFFCWVDQRIADWFKVRSEAIRRTKVALDEAGVDLPVPIYQVRLQRTQPASTVRTERPKPSRDAAAHEVVVDRYLDEQIEADRRNTPKETNLLTDSD